MQGNYTNSFIKVIIVTLFQTLVLQVIFFFWSTILHLSHAKTVKTLAEARNTYLNIRLIPKSVNMTTL